MRWMLALKFIISITISQEEFPRQFTIKHMPIHSCLIPTLAMTGKCKLTIARVLFVFDLFCSLPRIFKFRVLCGGRRGRCLAKAIASSKSIHNKVRNSKRLDENKLPGFAGRVYLISSNGAMCHGMYCAYYIER